MVLNCCMPPQLLNFAWTDSHELLYLLAMCSLCGASPLVGDGLENFSLDVEESLTTLASLSES